MTPTWRAVFIASVFALAPTLASAAESCSTADRAVELILDASGSMNAKLPNGETRIAVARRAVKSISPGKAQVSLRVYGAQSPTSRHDCKDSRLAVPFGPVATTADAIAASAESAKAQGYTPIAYSLDEAARDFLPPAPRIGSSCSSATAKKPAREIRC